MVIKMKRTVKIDQNKCVGCAKCVMICPQKMLKLGQSGKAEVNYTITCDERFGCVRLCPVGAIEIIEAK